jgi:hypothetical protein
MRQDIGPLCRRAAAELTGQRAQAVVLTGSQARGVATPESDVDLVAIGSGPSYDLSLREGRLVSVSWRTEAEQRQRFGSPPAAVTEIQGWRSAGIIADDAGIAAALQDAAANWSWEQIDDAAREWVAAELTGYAEEVHKLAAALRHGRPRGAAVQRNVLATHLALVLAVHFRILTDSENDIWDMIADRAGPGWRSAQDRALGLGGQSLAASGRAALELYCAAAAVAGEVCTGAQRLVVTEATELACDLLAE